MVGVLGNQPLDLEFLLKDSLVFLFDGFSKELKLTVVVFIHEFLNTRPLVRLNSLIQLSFGLR